MILQLLLFLPFALMVAFIAFLSSQEIWLGIMASVYSLGMIFLFSLGIRAALIAGKEQNASQSSGSDANRGDLAQQEAQKAFRSAAKFYELTQYKKPIHFLVGSWSLMFMILGIKLSAWSRPYSRLTQTKT